MKRNIKNKLNFINIDSYYFLIYAVWDGENLIVRNQSNHQIPVDSKILEWSLCKTVLASYNYFDYDSNDIYYNQKKIHQKKDKVIIVGSHKTRSQNERVTYVVSWL